jgi:phytoene/squalene synthetase
MIGEMRLQWWRDVLEEIASGSEVRRHEVASPLSEVLDATGARLLDQLVAARRWDLYREPFEDGADFERHLEQTGGGLMQVSGRALGASQASEETLRLAGKATALAGWFQAVPELEARGRVPLVDGRPDAVAALARAGLGWLAEARRGVSALPKEARAAILPGWETARVLRLVAAAPQRVAEGSLAGSEAGRRLALIRAALLGRI